MDTLTTAFDNLTAAFAALKPAGDLFVSVTALYKTTCDMYAYAAAAYSNAVDCAMITALEAAVKAAEDNIEAFLHELRAANIAEPNATAAKVKAAAWKAKTAENAFKAKALEQAAKVAETKAQLFRAKAEEASRE